MLVYLLMAACFLSSGPAQAFNLPDFFHNTGPRSEKERIAVEARHFHRTNGINALIEKKGAVADTNCFKNAHMDLGCDVKMVSGERCRITEGAKVIKKGQSVLVDGSAHYDYRNTFRGRAGRRDTRPTLRSGGSYWVKKGGIRDLGITVMSVWCLRGQVEDILRYEYPSPWLRD